MNKMRISKKLFVLISIALPLQIAFSTVSAQDSFIVCDYKQSLIEIVPDSFICGYTFSPSGYKPYGLFLQKDSAGYQMLLNYYKYDRDKVDTEMSSATMRLSEWEVESELEKLINNAKKDLDNAKQREKADADAAKDDNVVKVLMSGRAAEHLGEFTLWVNWYDMYESFKFDLGPEPFPNNNRWEVTPYYDSSETPYDPQHWIGSNDLSDWYFVVYPGEYTGGCVFVDHWGSSGCIVEEIDKKGKMVNVTCTDERGLFRLQIVDPGNSIRATYKRYDPERRSYIVYKPVVMNIAQKHHDYYQSSSLAKWFELNESSYSKRPKQLKKQVVISGKIYPEEKTVSGIVMNGSEPIKDAAIAEIDSKGNVITQTTSESNGEFTLDIADFNNKLRISAPGFAQVSQNIDGVRYVIIF